MQGHITQYEAMWFFIAGTYLMVLWSGFAIGFFIRWWKSEKQIRKEVYTGIANKNPYSMAILRKYRKR